MYATMMDTSGNILIKILDEKYSQYVVTINNVHVNEETHGVDFDVLNFPDELNDDENFVRLVQMAVGDIVAKAITAREADIAKAEHDVQDEYFTKILRAYNLHSKVDLTTTQAMKCLKMYPVPILTGEDEDLPAEGSDLSAYYDAMSGRDCDYSVIDLDDNNKEYNMTIPEQKDAFINLLLERGKDYFFK